MLIIGKQYNSTYGIVTYAGKHEFDVECCLCCRRSKNKNEAKFVFMQGIEQYCIGTSCLKKFITK